MRQIGLGIRRLLRAINVRAPALLNDLISDNWMMLRPKR